MLDSIKISKFITLKRREKGLTQQQLADQLNVSFQAVSKWETGSAYPNVELLYELAGVLEVSVDEILDGNEKSDSLSYRKAGVDTSYTDSIKEDMKKYLKSEDKRILNGVGPFASLYDISFPEIKNPVLVLKSEEPGSKQKLAMEYGYTESICHDMINHLINDIAVMGARPLAVLDTIVCGYADKDTIHAFIKGIAEACHNNECSLVGGETSVQPQVLESRTYILSASVAGIVDRELIIDGSAIQEGDSVLAVASNGLHTNGFSLVRMIMEKKPQIKLERIGQETFIEQIMRPHTAYYPAIKELIKMQGVHGMAHITGGGIADNLCRIIPSDLSAVIDCSRIRTLDIFRLIKAAGNISDPEMRATFNCGVGLVLVVAQEEKQKVIGQMGKYFDCYEIGFVEQGNQKVVCNNQIRW